MRTSVLFLLVLTLLTAPAFLFAESPQESYNFDLSEEELRPYNETIEGFAATRQNQSLGELTIGELSQLSAALSIKAQEEDYVRRARQSSHLFPGSGHFMIGEAGRGAAFATGSVLVFAGSVVGAYFVLPDAVQFDELDYIDDSFRDIGNAWRGESISSMLPAAGVLLSGAIINAILGEIASSDAERRARDQIESGEKRFTPEPFIYPDAQGRLMLGARIGL